MSSALNQHQSLGKFRYLFILLAHQKMVFFSYSILFRLARHLFWALCLDQYLAKPQKMVFFYYILFRPARHLFWALCSRSVPQKMVFFFLVYSFQASSSLILSIMLRSIPSETSEDGLFFLIPFSLSTARHLFWALCLDQYLAKPHEMWTPIHYSLKTYTKVYDRNRYFPRSKKKGINTTWLVGWIAHKAYWQNIGF
jgi:hypothetical protein